jgi:hypothetical protein
MKHEAEILTFLSKHFPGKDIKITEIFRETDDRVVCKVNSGDNNYVATYQPENKREELTNEIERTAAFVDRAIAPPVILSDPIAGILLTRFIESDEALIDKIADDGMIEKLGKTLK